ncbi:DNA repair protein RAD50 isoform X1 [Folsomia candida]|nr:DNA repair protein RAD50 isoform X1 [Folsomia candida]
MARYESELSVVLDAVKTLGSAEGSLATSEEVLEELNRFQSVDLTTIIHQRREKNEQLKQTTGILKQSLDVKLKSFDSFTEQLFEELRLELVSDLVKCYEIVTKEAYEENGKPPKRPKLDGGLADGLAFRNNEEINRIQQELSTLESFRQAQEVDHQKTEQASDELTRFINHNRSCYQDLMTEVNSSKSVYKDLKSLKAEVENCSNLDEISNFVILENYKTSMSKLKNSISEAVRRIDAISNNQNSLKAQEAHVNELKEALSKIMELKMARNNFQIAKASASTLDLSDIPNLQSKLNQNNYNLKVTSINFAEMAAKISIYQKHIEKYPNAVNDFKNLQTDVCNLQNQIEKTDHDEKEKRNQIIKKHQDMIDDINNYLKDYWEMLFPHDDIPTILMEAAKKSEGAIRVDYNYHFKMQTCRNNEELQMRGRSSHGEKILASLIIRCAFTEKFASGCPIVAFDEPEGCLDEGVVRNLVDHFSSITGSNQVIVTSYDEEFCRKLAEKCEDGCALYRIDKENGSSTLTLSAEDNSSAE